MSARTCHRMFSCICAPIPTWTHLTESDALPQDCLNVQLKSKSNANRVHHNEWLATNSLTRAQLLVLAYLLLYSAWRASLTACLEGAASLNACIRYTLVGKQSSAISTPL